MSVWKTALSVITQALSVVGAASKVPGVDLIPYVGTISKAAAAIEAGIAVGARIEPYISAVAETFSGGLPTEEKRAALDKRIAELEAEIQAPLPPPEEGEED